MTPRRFPKPLSIVEADGCFIVKDRDGQAYFEEERDRRIAFKPLRAALSG
jgi:hypothetical protein